MNNHRRDPWADVKTCHGLPADEIISTLQKSIRRGMTDNALLVAHEMTLTSPELEAVLWTRLMVIAVEDVGLGDPAMPVLIETLERAHERHPQGTGDRFLFAAHAVRMLSAAQKDRGSDEMGNWARLANESGTLPEIPDYAIDMHTRRGQALGRDLAHFLDEGARLENEVPGRDMTYAERIHAANNAGKNAGKD